MSKWTKEQELAITENGKNIIVSAGAGSGKTAVLTERTIRKLLNGTNINNLLILTFTNAAANEMKERIRTAIKKAGLVEQLNYIDSAYITTFDSFALSIVKKYHLKLGLSKDISIMDSSIELLKTNEILEYIFEKNYGENDFDKLINDFCTKTDDFMKDVVKSISKKLDLLSNKKEYLENYINEHYSENIINKYKDEYINKIIEKKEKINNYYNELKSRVDKKYIDNFNIEPLISSNNYEDIKHSLTVIGKPIKNKNCENDFKIYKDKITNIIKELVYLTRFDDVYDIIDSIKSTEIYVRAICKIINEFDELFLKYKKENNIYTFSDIALMCIKLIKGNEEIRNEISLNFDEIMIDEYQDTSNIQEEFINLISNNNLYMVGDIKQSIYRFRNANPYIFRNKYNDYSKNKGGIKIDLLKNFRSRKEVLDNINLIFNLIMDNSIGDADYKNLHQMNFGNINYIENNVMEQDNNMIILTYNPKEIENYSSDEIEAFTAAYDIREKVLNKYKVVDKQTNKLRNCTYSDFAIIMDRGSSFDLYKKIFEYVGVPIIQIKNEKLTMGYDIMVLKNLFNLILKVNLNELDDEFKYLFTSVSRSFIFKTTDEEIFNYIKLDNVYESELYNKCKDINIFELSNLDLINRVLNDFDYYNKIITTNNIKESLTKIDYLKDLSLNLSNIGYTPVEFIKYLNDIMDKGEIEYSLNTDNSDSVKILNIHKSKGLEYNICYFTGLTKKSNDQDSKAKFVVDFDNTIITPYVKDGIKQTILKDLLMEKEECAKVSEKIRLFYVALTRTKEKIIMITSLDKEKENYTSLVPDEIRLNYNRISDMLESIFPKIEPYIKDIDFNKVKLTRDFELNKNINLSDKLSKVNIKIKKIKNEIEYEELKKSKFSKDVNNLMTKVEYDNIKFGNKLHYFFETEDFKNTSNAYVLKFLKHIDNNYIKCYKEYEFLWESDNEVKHGFIDLMLEYDDYITIIDYKTKNINDEAYVRQLSGYKQYIEKICNKKVMIYLYSILDDELVSII